MQVIAPEVKWPSESLVQRGKAHRCTPHLEVLSKAIQSYSPKLLFLLMEVETRLSENDGERGEKPSLESQQDKAKAAEKELAGRTDSINTELKADAPILLVP